MKDRLKLINFVMIVAFIVSLLLAVANEFLKDRKNTNVRNDKKESILGAVGIDTDAMTYDEMITNQIQDAKKSKGSGDLEKLFFGTNSWIVD